MFKNNKKTKIAIFISGGLFVFFQNNVYSAEYNPNLRQQDIFKDSKYVGLDSFKENEKRDTDSYTKNRQNLSNAVGSRTNYDNTNDKIALYSINQKNSKNFYNSENGQTWIKTHRMNYQTYNGKNSKDENYLTRQTATGKRVVYAYGEKDPKNQRGNYDSTYIVPDLDYFTNDPYRVFDCSKTKYKIREIVNSCPAGMTVADNSYTGYSSNKTLKGYEFINDIYHSHNVYSRSDSGAYDKFIYDEKNKKGWQNHYPTSECYNLESGVSSGCSVWGKNRLYNDGTMSYYPSHLISKDIFANGVSLYESTIYGAGTYIGKYESGCFYKIKLNDPRTYSNKTQVFYDHNCAVACPTKADNGSIVEVKVIEDCALKKDKYGNKFYRTNDNSTISEAYPRGTAQKEYIKEYAFKNSKGYMKDPTNMSAKIHSCDLWTKKLSKQTYCVADENLIEGILSLNEWKGPKPTDFKNGPNGCEYNGRNCPPPTPSTPTPPKPVVPTPPTPPKPPVKVIITLKGTSTTMTNEIQEAANRPISKEEDQIDKVINFDGKTIETPFNIYQYTDPNDKSISFFFVVDPKNPNKYYKVRYAPLNDSDEGEEPIRYWRQIY